MFVTYLIAADTYEEKIHDIIKGKQALFHEVIDDLSDTNLSKMLTEEELFGLFGLQKQRRPIKASVLKSSLHEDGALVQISARRFEEMIAELFKKMGFYVKLTQKTRDQGVDIYAKRDLESGTEYLAIQCKHYPDGTVGVEHVRELYGVIQSQPAVTKAVLITSGQFSKDCKDFARDKRIQLFDRAYVLAQLQKYGISV